MVLSRTKGSAFCPESLQYKSSIRYSCQLGEFVNFWGLHLSVPRQRQLPSQDSSSSANPKQSYSDQLRYVRRESKLLAFLLHRLEFDVHSPGPRSILRICKATQDLVSVLCITFNGSKHAEQHKFQKATSESIMLWITEEQYEWYDGMAYSGSRWRPKLCERGKMAHLTPRLSCSSLCIPFPETCFKSLTNWLTCNKLFYCTDNAKCLYHSKSDGTIIWHMWHVLPSKIVKLSVAGCWSNQQPATDLVPLQWQIQIRSTAAQWTKIKQYRKSQAVTHTVVKKCSKLDRQHLSSWF